MNPDKSIVHADPMKFSEFVDQNGLVCFQIQTHFSFEYQPQLPILRVSRQVWLAMHDDSVSLADEVLTSDEQIVMHVKAQVDLRVRRTPTSPPKSGRISNAEYDGMLSDIFERQIWDLRLENVVFGDVTQPQARQIKIGSLFVKSETENLQVRMRRNRRPPGFWLRRFFIPYSGC